MLVGISLVATIAPTLVRVEVGLRSLSTALVVTSAPGFGLIRLFDVW